MRSIQPDGGPASDATSSRRFVDEAKVDARTGRSTRILPAATTALRDPPLSTAHTLLG
jgi:hypothetical protein